MSRALACLVLTFGLLAPSAAASPPLDLVEEAGVRLEPPPAAHVGAADGPNLGLAGVGDVNDDGLPDLAFGNPGENGTPGGAVHVVFGRPSLRSTPRIALPANEGFTITAAAERRIGERVAGAGDVNGDGFDDILVASVFDPSVDADRGSAYVVFGGPSPADLDLDSLGPRGFRVANTGQFERLAGPGDLDGDGFDDIAVGAGVPDVAVIYGGPAPQSLDALDLGNRGFTVTPGEDFVYVGQVARAGDVNGDSRPDLLAGIPASQERRAAVVVFGGARRGEPLDLSELGSGGFLMRLDDSALLPAQSVAGVGDFDGDGLDDVAIQSEGRGQYGVGPSSRPAVYVVFGADSTAAVELEDLGARGVRLLTGRHGLFGAQVAAPGDVNRDGHADVLVGVRGDHPYQGEGAGRAYVALGGPVTADLALRGLRGPGDNPRGFAIRGVPFDETGHRVAGPGDMDGDGWNELAILSFRCSGHDPEFSGFLEFTAEVHLPDFLSRSRGLGVSTQGADRLVATADSPRLRGRGGGDELIGHAGADCLYGDDGDETIGGGGGPDVLAGGVGDDEVAGGADEDFVHGAFGADSLTGGEGRDYVFGGPGDDVLVGGPGADDIQGRRGADVIRAADGEPDSIHCGWGQDRVERDPEDSLYRCEQSVVARRGG
ncbi:MAG TPA: hypothetical protein VD790_01495 [Thermoleophilaceae bacterium]|nr:hypothetical protein [Thermoleophilaceae bacterium]